MARGISLANKVLVVYGFAIVVIVLAALTIPAVRTRTNMDAAQFEQCRNLATAVENGTLSLGKDNAAVISHVPAQPAAAPTTTARVAPPTPADDTAAAPTAAPNTQPVPLPSRTTIAPDYFTEVRFIPASQWSNATDLDPTTLRFLDAARNKLIPALGGARTEADPYEHAEAVGAGDARRYRLARVIDAGFGRPRGVVIVDHRSPLASGVVFVDRVLMIASGLFASTIAFALFFYITRRIVFAPVRELTDTAELVRAGNISIRADIKTGDEFEQLSDAFNAMLENMVEQQHQLRGINKSLDLKLTELAEANVALYETAQLKGEFLANVSHELRTPLNSIIGFAEILRDIAERELTSAKDTDNEHEITIDAQRVRQLQKRRRYTENIVTAGRTLLEMINELLVMAKIEAGRVTLNLAEMSVADSCEGLLALIRPLAEKKNITLELQLGSGNLPANHGKPGSDLPVVYTDAQKLEQIVFNFLSNAVKFTPENGKVTLRAERLAAPNAASRVRVSVIDTGPGIPPEHQDAIFEKFAQLDRGHTRAVTGTGLGLAIAKQFAEMLQGEIQLVSEAQRGSTFSVIVPARLDESKLNTPAADNTEDADGQTTDTHADTTTATHTYQRDTFY